MKNIRAKSYPTAPQLLDYFNKRIAGVHQSTSGSPDQTSLESPTSTLDEYVECVEEEVRKTIINSQSKSCIFGPLPTNMRKEFVPEVLPHVTDMCNALMREGSPLLSQRHTIITA